MCETAKIESDDARTPEASPKLSKDAPFADNCVAAADFAATNTRTWHNVAIILQLRYNLHNYPDDVEPTVVRRNGSRKGLTTTMAVKKKATKKTGVKKAKKKTVKKAAAKKTTVKKSAAKKKTAKKKTAKKKAVKKTAGKKKTAKKKTAKKKTVRKVAKKKAARKTTRRKVAKKA